MTTTTENDDTDRLARLARLRQRQRLDRERHGRQQRADAHDPELAPFVAATRRRGGIRNRRTPKPTIEEKIVATLTAFTGRYPVPLGVVAFQPGTNHTTRLTVQTTLDALCKAGTVRRDHQNGRDVYSLWRPAGEQEQK